MFDCNGLFYYPNTQVYGSPRDLDLAYESLDFSAADGTALHGLFFPAQGRTRGTVLHLHGNAGNVSGHFQHVAWLPAAGWNVFCFDYRGYGKSQGRTTRQGTVNDAHGALDYLLSRPELASDCIVAFGQSLGGAVGIVLAAQRREIRAIAVDGAFDDYRRVAFHHVMRNPLLLVVGFWVPWLLMDKGLDPIDYVGRIAPRPILIVQGTKDRVVSAKMAERLHAAAGEPKELWLVEGADHYEALRDLPHLSQPRLLRFFETALTRAVPPPSTEPTDSCGAIAAGAESRLRSTDPPGRS